MHGGKRPGAGKPKGYKAYHTIQAEQAKAYIIKRVTEELEPIMDKAIEQAKKGDQASRKDLLDRAYGKAVEPHELSGKDGEPIKVSISPEVAIKNALATPDTINSSEGHA